MDTSQALSEPEHADEFQEIFYESLGIKIFAGLNTPRAKLVENIRTNIKRGLPQVWPHQPQDTVCCVVAGGPSLADSLDDIRTRQADGAMVVALANTAHYLMAHGIRPNSVVLLDAKPNPQWIVPELKCTYFVASQCDPVMFDALQGMKYVYIWHAINNREEFDSVFEGYDQWVPIQGGNTMGLRTLRLLDVLGYHRFELFGMDGCLIDGCHHVYPQPMADKDRSTGIEVNGRRFEVTAWMIQQAIEFLKVVKMFGQKWEMVVHGDGLLAHMVKSAGE